MLDREEFIENQAAFQFGICEAQSGLDIAETARLQAERRGQLFFHDPADDRFVPEERAESLARDARGKWQVVDPPGQELIGGFRLVVARQADVLNDLLQMGMGLPFMADMRDALRLPNPFPVFQYNRLGGARNSILWPLHRVHGIGAKSFCFAPDPAETPFRDKKPGLCWRGAVRGFTMLDNRAINISTIVKRYMRGKVDRETLVRHLNALPRYIFMSRYFGKNGFDIGFSNRSQDTKGWPELPEIGRYQKPYATAAEQAEHKYLFCIQGTDVGSSFGWQLGTKSVILKESYSWEVFFDCHLRAWEHFVPIEPGFADLEEKIAWCEANPDACEAQIARRHALVPLLLDEELRSEALRRVVARYNEFYAGWGCANSRAAE